MQLEAGALRREARSRDAGHGRSIVSPPTEFATNRMSFNRRVMASAQYFLAVSPTSLAVS